MKTIAIDFDGVIHTYDKGWQDGSIYGELMPGAEDGLVQLQSLGSLFIFSTRDSKQILDWMKVKLSQFEFQVIPDQVKFWNYQHIIGITNRKLPAAIYIDDRAWRFTSWHDLNALPPL